ncbi:hypothetical protein DCCM_2648 [Desulfocucumis palustris]|uniref:Uroporphyrinogen decarboxylase (URO-D) domain-containing protein n=1 Tax=Desulfocucumis palustris TaxID=1898651 RepID=A0A2L2XH46_9FIRM|nr:hypothetical protein [Desulfocucumis palustris]GBF33546.1 hypothetical protein DCCM_2648 [Desulfocucumis palustris]
MSGSLPGKCLTTAMGILPHTAVEPALELALKLDIPFWPQLPRFSFYEDMYVQVSEHFPGIIVDQEKLRIQLDMEKFYGELPDYVEKMEERSYLELSPKYSVALDAFLERDLSSYPVIRGQSIGPVSFGLKITDRELKPIIYNDEVRDLLFDFIARKLNAQYGQLKEKNDNAFVWLDEPGLEILFGSFTGYSSHRAKEDYRNFLKGVNGPKGVHLCGNPDWSFLLDLELDILSVDIFGWGHIFTRYHQEVISFMERGGIISWGIVPTLTEEIDAQTADGLVQRLESLWLYLEKQGAGREMIYDRAWLAPARCCLINADGNASVEKAFSLLKDISLRLREKWN